MPRNQRDATYDHQLLLKDAGAVTADGVATVAAVARILDLGAARIEGRMIADVTAIDVVTGDESYLLRLQFSNSPTFASGVVGGAIVQLGGATALVGESAASVIGRYEAAFANQVNGITYRYARLYVDVAGTTPSINFIAYLVK